MRRIWVILTAIFLASSFAITMPAKVVAGEVKSFSEMTPEERERFVALMKQYEESKQQADTRKTIPKKTR